MADENGISFLIPRPRRSSPLVAGEYLIYYHTSVSAGADVARAREKCKSASGLECLGDLCHLAARARSASDTKPIVRKFGPDVSKRMAEAFRAAGGGFFVGSTIVVLLALHDSVFRYMGAED